MRSGVVSTDVPGLRMEFRYTAVPAELATEPGADQLFDAAWMRRLDALGYALPGRATPASEYVEGCG